MNPLTNMRNLNKMNEREISMGTAGDDKRSWHSKYKGSAWVYVGGLPYTLTEGDVICVFSQYGELVNINLIRDHKTGKSKGFCFLCYEDQRSTNLAVDNLNGTKIVGRIIRVDHVDEYKVPKLHEDTTDKTKSLYLDGCAPKPIREARRPDEPASEEETTPLRPVDTDMLLPVDKEQARDIKKVKKRLKREAKEAKRAAKRKLEEAAEFDRAHGGTGDVKPNPSAWSWSKPKDKEGNEIEFGDEEDFKPEHRVQMAHFDTLKVRERHMGKGAADELSYHEQEILKIEREREKRLAGDTSKGLKKGDKTYVPKRFAGHKSARL